MQVGIVYFFTDQTIDITRLATEVEQRGFSALFFTDHSHIPVNHTPYPEAYGGGELPEFYKRTYETFTAMTWAAAKTSTLTIGAGCVLAAQRDPVYMAKEVASIDHLSGGRVVFGVAFGWNQPESEQHGVEWRKRFSTVREKVELMRTVWTQDVASYSGQFASLPPSWSWPKPVQRPHPPILVGGAGPLGMKHAALWGDEWYPVPTAEDVTLEKAVPAFRAVCEEVGRDPSTADVSVASAPGDVAILETYRELGIKRANLWLNPGSADDTLRELEHLTDVLHKLG